MTQTTNTMRMHRSLTAAGLLTAAALLSGCAKDQHPDATSAAGGPPPATLFERAKDPPITAETHFAAGQLAESHGDFPQAITQYRNALVLDKNHLPAMYRLGCVYAQAKRYSDALQTWNRYVQATHGSAEAYSNLAFTHELAGNPNAAETDYKRGIEHDPKNQACRVNYGLMLARHARIAEATVQFQAVLSPAEVHYNLATVHELQRRKDLAKVEYQKALALDPNFADARTKLASLGNE